MMIKIIFFLLLTVNLSCGLYHYPGQPGAKTNSYAKIELEYLDGFGLWIYEASYDNSKEGEGVAAIITKLIKNATTFTSSVRTNMDGTLYRSKASYEGAEIQMISLPRQKTVILSPQSKVNILVSVETSFDEIDDRNLAEEGIFKKKIQSVADYSHKAYEFVTKKINLLQVADISPTGQLSYTIASMKLGPQKIVFKTPIEIMTNFLQTSITAHINEQAQVELERLLDDYFPNGYSGSIDFYLKDKEIPLAFNLSLHTRRSLKNNGVIVIENMSKEEINHYVEKI